MTDNSTKDQIDDTSPSGGAAIAIVGMSGRFPGADSVRKLWSNLRDGVESFHRFTADELEDSFSDEVRNSPEFVPVRPMLDNVDQFDADFFNMHAREAALTDPQQRVFLECCWEALEDAGYDPARYAGAIGVFAGTGYNTYLIKHVFGDRAAVEEFTSNYQVGSYQEFVASLQDFVATRVAYKLDLKGPAVNVQSACSTSLLAVAEACKSLLLYQADMALAGGVSITFPQKRGYISLEGGMVSPEGRCRPYDADASGTVFGSGAGAVLLKRLDDALADGDTIYAVIRGFGVNNDGAQKVGFTAPSVDGQAAAIASALAMAGVDADGIGYVEGHGTATPLGDPIEFKGLEKAFRASTDKRNYCVLGSSKANFGHLDVAAGISGLIKASLVLAREEIPPLINFSKPNPNIDVAASPFKFVTELTPWPQSATPRLAGVSSFGVGGTNVHVVLEEAPRHAPKPAASECARVLPIAARTPESLARLAAALADHLESAKDTDLDDVAYTLQVGRRAFDCRAAIVASDAAEAAAKLRAIDVTKVRAKANAPKVVFMFPGQGAQYPGMGKALYDAEPVYRDHVDLGAAVLEPLIGADLRKLLFSDVPADDDTPHPIRSTVMAQPALFVTEYAMAQLLMSRGIEPDSMIGHSVGEFVAAALAGVLSFEDALKLVAARGRLMQDQEPGAMLSVRTGEARLKELLVPGVDIAAVNAPNLSVASGPFDAIAKLEARLDAEGVAHRRLHTSHAFHSAMMDGVVEGLKVVTAGMQLSPPTRPYVSSVSGTWVESEEATSSDYWARHCRQTVRFAEAMATLLQDQNVVLIEVGPGRTLSTFAGQAKAKANVRTALPTLPEFANRGEDRATFAAAIAGLWCEGVAVDWTPFQAPGARRISLPTYAFARKRHWIEAPAPLAREPAAPTAELVTYETLEVLQPLVAAPLEIIDTSSDTQADHMSDRSTQLQAKICGLLEELSGESLDGASTSASFLELGFDSLFLGQVAQRLQKVFGVKVTFRQLMREYPSIDALAAHLMANAKPENLPATAAPAPAPQAPRPAPVQAQAPVARAVAAPVAMPVMQAPAMPALSNGTGFEGVMQSQLVAMQQLIAQQLQVMQSVSSAGSAGVPPALTAPTIQQSAGKMPALPAEKPAAAATEEEPTAEAPSRFAMFKPGNKTSLDEITPQKKRFIDDLIARINKKTPGSKARTQAYRDVLADPRTANAFRAEWKEIVHPIVAAKSKGSKIWDVDGNEYVDLVSGFGQTMFGHAPDFVVEAVSKQLHEGFSIGPQSPLAHEVARMFAEMTDNERVTFCNTGSEAVMAAMRVARAVTGRDTVVMFSGDYHGQFDEVLVKATASKTKPGALPIAPGIPRDSVANVVVLPYGAPESIAWVREHQDEIAAVVAETVQSRHPDLRPREFLLQMRKITEACGAALVFDEVVTGFRVHPGGMQAIFGIKADMATYGKVVGGGMPVGVLAGKAQFMDALDGGFWNYGDDSVPEVAPTFFAGTFVRHPLVMAACRATLTYMKEKGPALQQGLGDKTKRLVDDLNAFLAQRGVKTRLETFSSWCYANFAAEDPLASLLHHHLRLLGIHVIEGFPWYITTAHSDADLAKFADAFKKSIDALQAAGILEPSGGPEHPGPNGGGTKPTKERDSVSAPAAGTPVPARAMNGSGVHAQAAANEVALTEEQREVWLAAQLSDGASCAYNEGSTLTLEGELKPDVLAAALNDVVARHDALRATISRLGDRLHIAPTLKIAMPLVDLSGAVDAEARFNAILDEEARTPFDLANGPLLRARLVRRAADKHAVVFTAHHIVCDGWSSGVVMQELGAFYAARLEGKTADLAPALSFKTYATDRNAPKPTDAETEQFWLGEYKDLPPPLELPSDRGRPPVKTFKGATYTEQIDADLINAVKKAGARQGTTLFATLFAATQVVLGKLGGEQDIALTVPMAGQTAIEDEVLVGHCVNFLPVRAQFDATAPFAKHLEAVKAKMFTALDHQNYTYGTLVSRLAIKRDPNRTPITDVQFNHEKFGEGVVFPRLTASVVTNPKAFVVFDLFFNMTESDKGVRVDVDYATDLYDASTIKRWVGHLRSLLREIATDASRPIKDMSVLNAEERRWLIQDLNATQMDYPKDALVHEMVEAQAARTPDAVALKYQDTALTYRELDGLVTHMAARFATLLPGGGKRIAVALPRSHELIVALLAVLKSGNAYVPLDATHPAARLTQTIEAADISMIVCAEDHIAALAPNGVQVVRLDQPAAAAYDVGAIKRPAEGASASAYVIFTSGSTGTPKGVEIEHRSVVNFLASMAKAPGFTARDSIVTVTTVSFDIAGLEMYLPLVTGGTAIIVSREQVKDGFALVDVINRSNATVLQATPSLWRMLVEAGLKLGPHLKMLCGGEPLPRDLANRLLDGGGELWNVYGPTETTIWSSAGLVARGAEAITIGAPIANTDIHILDIHDKLAPVGAVGDVYIGGDGLARGYFKRSDLTAAAFRMIDLGDGVARRLYRTGDVGRRTVDGAIQLQGRKDQQIKLRGYRIELEDIETHLRRAPGVSDGAVAVQGAGEAEPRLVGYYVTANGQDIAPNVLARHLAQNLPEYMVPTLWQRLDAMPQTANGKLNRKALPPVRVGRQLKVVAETASAPLTAMEARLAPVWKELLEKDDVTPDTHFFEAGGHSLLAMRLIARLQTELNRPVTIADLFRAPRLADFAKAVAATADGSENAKIVRLQASGTRTPLIVINNAWNLFPLAKALGPDQPITSIQFVDREIEEPKGATTWNEIVDEAVRLIRLAQPHGEYMLLGHCVLGSVALEAARRLKAEGEEVRLVTLFDTEPNLKFKNIPLGQRAYNYAMLQIRNLRWYGGLWLDGKINATYILRRYKTPRRLGLVALADRLGFKERWYEEDFHTQHVVDAWMEQTSVPYDGNVVLYRAQQNDRQGFLDRWLPWVPAWRSIIGDRLTVETVKISHGQMFRDEGIAAIGPHLKNVLDDFAADAEQPKRERPAQAA